MAFDFNKEFQLGTLLPICFLFYLLSWKAKYTSETLIVTDLIHINEVYNHYMCICVATDNNSPWAENEAFEPPPHTHIRWGENLFLVLVLYSVLKKKNTLSIRKVGMNLLSGWYLYTYHKTVLRPSQNEFSIHLSI